jgi:Zn-dependent protease
MTAIGAEEAGMMSCPNCGTEISLRLLACPVCHTLAHRDRLKQLAAEAEGARAQDDLTAEVAAWREALLLLPPDAKQYAVVEEKLQALSQRIEGQDPAWKKKADQEDRKKFAVSWLAGLGVFGLLAWKFKFLIVLLLTKGKLILLGLSKSTTLFSMLLSLGVYWQIWGFGFALGLILCIYLHEMGHVMALNRYGIPASAPMFIPGFGALIRSRYYPSAVHEQAVIGLAGPIWGLIASILCFGLYAATAYPLFAALATVNAWINLFNLIPVWQLDGSHAFQALTRSQRWWVCGLLIPIALASHEALVWLLVGFAVVQIFQKKAAAKPDRTILAQYLMLALVLAMLAKIPVALSPG